jgi:hypothetical protein
MEGKRIGSVLTPFGMASVMQGHYLSADGPMAIWLDSEEDGSRIAVLSINLSADPGPGRFFAKTYSENEPLRDPLLACGLFEDTGESVRTGFAVAEVWALRPEALAEAA